MKAFYLSLIFVLGLAPQWEASAMGYHPPDYVALTQQQREKLAAAGFEKWVWLQSKCDDCEIAILSEKAQLHSKESQAFLLALRDRKAEIKQLYGVSDQEYNLLAQIAIGILGRESEFFTNTRYWAKEHLPGAVWIVKWFLSCQTGVAPDLDSRGPTQIKVVPQPIEETYGIRPETLYIPENAALATIGFLIESLTELKNRVEINDLDFVTPETYADYLPYIYFGGTKKLINHTATPDTNIYVRDMKKYMSWIEIYQRPREVIHPGQ